GEAARVQLIRQARAHAPAHLVNAFQPGFLPHPTIENSSQYESDNDGPQQFLKCGTHAGGPFSSPTRIPGEFYFPGNTCTASMCTLPLAPSVLKVTAASSP